MRAFSDVLKIDQPQQLMEFNQFVELARARILRLHSKIEILSAGTIAESVPEASQPMNRLQSTFERKLFKNLTSDSRPSNGMTRTPSAGNLIFEGPKTTDYQIESPFS